MQRVFQVAVLGTTLMAATTAAAVDARKVLKAGYDFGGDTLRSATFIDGRTETIDANEGFYLGFGLALLSDDLSVESHLTIGWKYNSVSASNGEVEFTRYPLEALLFYNYDYVRVGGGLAYHLSPELSASGAGLNFGGDEDFDNELGLILQADYRASDNVAVGARYTVMEYTDGEADVRANGFGVTVSGTF